MVVVLKPVGIVFISHTERLDSTAALAPASSPAQVKMHHFPMADSTVLTLSTVDGSFPPFMPHHSGLPLSSGPSTKAMFTSILIESETL